MFSRARATCFTKLKRISTSHSLKRAITRKKLERRSEVVAPEKSTKVDTLQYVRHRIDPPFPLLQILFSHSESSITTRQIWVFKRTFSSYSTLPTPRNRTRKRFKQIPKMSSLGKIYSYPSESPASCPVVRLSTIISSLISISLHPPLPCPFRQLACRPCPCRRRPRRFGH